MKQKLVLCNRMLLQSIFTYYVTAFRGCLRKKCAVGSRRLNQSRYENRVRLCFTTFFYLPCFSNRNTIHNAPATLQNQLQIRTLDCFDYQKWCGSRIAYPKWVQNRSELGQALDSKRQYLVGYNRNKSYFLSWKQRLDMLR